MSICPKVDVVAMVLQDFSVFHLLLFAFVLNVLALLLQWNLENLILALYFRMLLNHDVKTKQKPKKFWFLFGRLCF